MRIKAIHYYYDKQLKKHVQAGEEYAVDDKRGGELIALNLAVATDPGKKPGEAATAAKAKEK